MKSRTSIEDRKANWSSLKSRLRACSVFALSFFLCMIVIRVVEITVINEAQFLEYPILVFIDGLKNDLQFSLILYAIIFVILIDRKWITTLILLLLSIIALFHLISAFYFAITLIPLDHTVYQFTIHELYVIIETFGEIKWYYVLLILPILLCFLFHSFLKERKESTTKMYFLLPLLLLISEIITPINGNSEFTEMISINKASFFITDSWKYLNQSNKSQITDLTLQDEYPLLHESKYSNTLGPFFNLKEDPPNFVFIIVESLSSEYSGEESEVSFTPFLDSLASKSLYFPNFLSTAERTFGVLPSSLASLPHGEKGFVTMNHNMPNHYSLPKIMFENDYEGSFYYGGNSSFDNMNVFMELNGFKHIYDHNEFKDGGIGVDEDAFSIEDKQLFDNAVSTWPAKNEINPFLHVYLTSTMHYPYKFDQKESYIAEAKKIIGNKASGITYERLSSYAEVFSSSLYTDDALRDLISNYKAMPEYDNTIFFIYGDHSFGRIPKRDRLDKYRVPLIIYSSLLKRNKTINAVNSHLDIAPSILSMLEHGYSEFQGPAEVAWIGESFDTSSKIQSSKEISFMLNSRDVVDYLNGEYFLSEDKLFRISNDYELVAIENESLQRELIAKSQQFDATQKAAVVNNKIVPEEKDLILLASKKTPKKQFSDKDEYVMLLTHKFSHSHDKVAIDLKMLMEEKSEVKEDSTAPLLVITVRDNEGNAAFWSSDNYEHVKKMDSQIPSNRTYEFKLDKLIRANSELKIEDGYTLKIYWWNATSSGKIYQMKEGSIAIKGDVQ